MIINVGPQGGAAQASKSEPHQYHDLTWKSWNVIRPNDPTSKNKTLRMNIKIYNSNITMAGFTSIPVMDLSLCKSPSTKPQLLHDLRNALVRTGFFYVKNHSISEEVQQRAIDESTAFFKLPLDKKLEIETVNSKHFLGYNSMDTEWTAAKVDHNESIAV